MTNADENITSKQTLRLLARSLTYVWPYRRQIAIKLILSFIGIFLILFLPWPLKILVDHVVLGMAIADSPTPYPPYVLWFVNALEGLTPYEVLWAIVGVGLIGILTIGAFGSGSAQDQARDELAEGFDTATQSENLANVSNSKVSGLLGLLEFRYQLRTTHLINHWLRSLLYSRLMSLPMTRYADSSIGDAVYRVMYDTPSISKVCYDITVLPLVNLFVIGCAIWTMQYSFADVPSLVLIAWLAAPMMLLTTFFMTASTRRRSLASRSAGAATTATIEEGMSNVVAVQSLGANTSQSEHIATDSDRSFRKFRSYTVMTVSLNALRGFVLIGLILYVFLDIVDALIDERMSAGDYAVLYTYFFQISVGASELGAIWFNLQNNAAGMQRVFEVLDQPVDTDFHGTRFLPTPVATIELRNVSYSYPDGTLAIRGINLKARIGEMIALVGATGAGKSTLAYTIAGFTRPSEGELVFDGHDTDDLHIDFIRQQVAFVFQEPFVFDDSVANNIRMGHMSASEDELERAARVAGAYEFISELPEGFRTRLGRAGNTLSVGQKQRLAIARGVVNPAAILILDEPTAALDPETENALVQALHAEREQRLLIVIAHRMSTIRTADRILFIEAGEIIESGTHEELMAERDGAYRRYVDLQTGVAQSTA